MVLVKTAAARILAGSLALFTGVSGAAAPAPGGDFDCTQLLPSLQQACIVNNDLADKGSYGSYTNSCDGGGRCDDSVYNKLVSAGNKIGAGKLADACANLASIQQDLLTWSTASKPKVDQAGYNSLTGELTTVQAGYLCP